ncbi:MAG: MFS transporter [Caldilineaceae bacterium]|nr:MFS transporter [Caldilineaceae bacterium]
MQNSSWQRFFFIFWGAQAISLIGSNLAQFAITWWITKATGSATVLATATLFAVLPSVLLGPLAGVLVDRWNRRAIIMVADSVGAVGAAILMWLFWADAIQIWHLYAITFIRSLAGTFHFAAVQASTTLMVPNEQLARIAGLNQTIQGINMVVAPPLGALLLELLSLSGMMAIDVVTALIAVGLVFTVIIPQPPVRAQTAESHSILVDLHMGLRYIWQWSGLLWAICLGSFLNFLLSPAFSLLPILVTDHFNGDAFQFATLNTALGLGVIGGGLLLTLWGGFKRRIYTATAGIIGMAFGTLLLAIAPADGYWLAVAGTAIFGLLNPMTNGPFMAIMQSAVAPEMQGRFFTVMNTLSQGMTPLGLLLAGPLADAYGVQIWFLIGTLGLIVIGILFLCIPALRNLEDHRYAPAAVATTS